MRGRDRIKARIKGLGPKLFPCIAFIVSLSILVPIRIELYGDRWSRALLSVEAALMVGYA